MKNTLITGILAAVVAALASWSGIAHADVLLDNTDLIAATGAAPPSEFAFTTTTAEALTVTLTDFQEPAAFSSLQIAVTSGDSLVGMGTVDPTTHIATVAIPAGIGTYTLDVIGTPTTATGASIAIGSFGVCTAVSSTPSTCVAAYSFSGNIETPPTPSTTPSSALDTTFTSTTAGTYTVTITDDTFPVALQSISGGIAQGSTPVAQLAAGPNQVTLAAGTVYTLIIGALANATATAGLYGVNITDPTGAPIFFQTVPVGMMPAATVIDNPNAQSLSLSVTDLGYPTPLTSVGVALTSGSTLLATQTTSGSVPNFQAPAGSISVWQFAQSSSGQPGVYNVAVASTSNPALYGNTQVVNPSATSGQTFAFVADLPTAGSYTLAVTDYEFPAALASPPTAIVAQNGVALTQSSSGGFTASAGNIVIVVNAAAPSSGSGIFGVTVSTGGSTPQVLLNQTQSVGATFTTQSVTVGASGNYDVTLTDLKFPGNFSDLAVLVSQGSQILGKIYGGGTFTISVVPGTYDFTVVDTPSTTDNYGLYALHVASSAPTVTFTSSASSVTVGGTVQLTWSSTNATTCTASGASAWTGNELTSGSASVQVAATETLTLTCTGPGGSAAQSVALTATAAPSKSGGGGGLDLAILSLLGALSVGGRFIPRRPRRGTSSA
jgi:plastocyanin